MSARDDVLTRIRSALGPQRAVVKVPRDYRSLGDLPGPQLLDLLEERLADYGVHVWRTGREALPATVAAVLAEGGRLRVGVPLDLPFAVPGSVIDDGLTPRELDRLDGAVTLASVAIAETGTLVLAAGGGCGRRALTLVPDHHLCVLHAQRVVQTVPEALGRLDPLGLQTWISGPSATSDIELQRVAGVHGPRTLQVILVVDGRPPGGGEGALGGA